MSPSVPPPFQALGKLPPGQKLLLSLQVKGAPVVTLQSKKATVSIPANIHVLSYLPKRTPEPLFELNGVSDQELGVQHWGSERGCPPPGCWRVPSP